MKSEQTLETLNVRYEQASKVRDSHLGLALNGRENRADEWHQQCQRLTAAICYLEARVERLEKASAR